MKIFSLKRKTIPKIAVLATGLSAALMMAVINPAPLAQASPGYASACTGCHTAGGSVTATPSSATVAPGATYSVALVFTGGSSPVGYWISGNGASVTASNAGPVSMTAPAAAGSYTYTVWMRSGVAASTTYSITVGSVATTPPPTTVPPTTVPPTTVPPTTVPPTTVPPTTVPPTTEPPTVPPTTVPPTTVPPTTVPPTTIPPVSGANISSLSPDHGTIGSLMTIRGTGFVWPCVVKFGTVTATASSWTDNSIVVRVPWSFGYSVRTTTVETLPLWYRSPQQVPVTVTPKDGAASNAMTFSIDSRDGSRDGDGEDGHGLSPSSLLGQNHLGMYASYGAMNCKACHNGLTPASQASPPSLSMEGVDMKQGLACATCHNGQREFAIFIGQMQPAAATPTAPAGTQIAYGRCSECHAVATGGERDD